MVWERQRELCAGKRARIRQRCMDRQVWSGSSRPWWRLMEGWGDKSGEGGGEVCIHFAEKLPRQMERRVPGKWIGARQKWWAPSAPRLQNGGEETEERGERLWQREIYGKRKLEEEEGEGLSRGICNEGEEGFQWLCSIWASKKIETGDGLGSLCASTSTLLIHHSHLSL